MCDNLRVTTNNKDEESLLRSVNRDSLTKKDLVLKVLKSMRKDNDSDTGSNNAGKCYEGCPPQISNEFLDSLIKELEQEYCDHDDSAIQIAEYIVQEIKTNTRSKKAESIKELLSRKPTIYTFVSPTITAYSNFFDMVATGKPWDHKPIIRKKFKDQGVERPNNFNGMGDNIYKTFYTKYKDYDYFYDVWSNIHYGYIGRSIGFSAEKLTLGSNMQQLGHDLISGEFNFGDTGADKATILIGISLYDKFG